jgi:hypothetical protein
VLLIVHDAPDTAHIGGAQRRRLEQHCQQHKSKPIE